MHDNWYQVTNADAIDTPALLIYPERAAGNIDKLVSLVKNPSQLRPHVKTNKSARVSRLMVDRGITKFKCATIAEAEMLGLAGALDVLLAYQPNKLKLNRLIKLMAAYPDTAYSCLVDNAETAQMISDTAIAEKVIVPIFIDLNVGMNRTGIYSGEALELYKLLKDLPGIVFKGFHAYDGHIEDTDVDDRMHHSENDFAAVEELRRQLADQFAVPLPLLVAGGSPTITSHMGRANTECSPGTFVFWDKNYSDGYPDLPFQFAALVLTRVISLPGANKVCLDLGYKSVACEKPLAFRVHLLNAPDLVPVSHSEEHMVLEAPEGHHYKVGDLIYAVPRHVCPTVAMYNQAHIIDNGAFADKWDVDARGREISI